MPNSRLAETGGYGDNDNKNQNEDDDDSDAHPPAATPLVPLGSLEVVGPVADILGGVDDMVVDVVELLRLGLHHHRHIEEHLVELQQALLHLLSSIVPVLYLHHCLQHLPPPMLLFPKSHA